MSRLPFPSLEACAHLPLGTCPQPRGPLQRQGQSGLYNSWLPQEGGTPKLPYRLRSPGDLMAKMVISCWAAQASLAASLSIERSRLLNSSNEIHCVPWKSLSSCMNLSKYIEYYDCHHTHNLQSVSSALWGCVPRPHWKPETIGSSSEPRECSIFL